MSDLLLLSVLFVAVGVGWALGRFSAKGKVDTKAVTLPSQYYRGLNFLLDGSRDSAIDAFTKALEVNSETFDTHIALGNALRGRGEVERAIRVHQNLLARPSLPSAQLHLAHLELARDYISAGLLDRAEKLLLDLTRESVGHRRIAKRHLMEIYEAQSEWDSAREVAQSLLPKKKLIGGRQAQEEVGQPIPVLLAHYCCESAQEHIKAADPAGAKALLEQAIQYDRNCVRASIMLGLLGLKSGQHKTAVQVLRSVYGQDPDFVPETVSALRSCYTALGQRQELRHYLENCFRERPSPTLMVAIAKEIADIEGAEAAKVFLREKLREKPSLRGAAMLMELHTTAEAGDDEHLQIDVLRRLVESRSSYRCSHCGFRGQHLHWYCPGCKHWGTMKEMGATGEVVHA